MRRRVRAGRSTGACTRRPWAAGGAGRVTEPARRALVEVRALVVVGLGTEQLLVGHSVGHRGAGGVGAEDHDVAEARHVWRHLLEERDEVGIDQHDPVVGVVHDEGELLGAQPYVERVQHPPRARDSEVRLEMSEAVPGERGDALTRPDAERVERTHELLGPRGELAHGGAVNRSVREAAHDLGGVMVAAGAAEQQPGVQRDVHHRRAVLIHGRSVPAHCRSPESGGSRAPSSSAAWGPSVQGSTSPSPPTSSP